MIKEQRFDYILNALKAQEQVTYETLASSLQVSEDTIRRDIDQLYRNGLLSKIRGGAMLPAKNPLTFQDRSRFFQEEKDIIAMKAKMYIKDGMTIFMDGGTTICAIADALPADISLRIVTNNIPAVQLLSRFRNIELIVLGGTYDPGTATSTGIITCKEVNMYLADLYLMGTCGVDDKAGISASVASDAHVKRAMFDNAKTVISLANHSRLHQVEPFRVGSFSDLDIMITDLESDHADLNGFRNLGVHII
ncbi:DeoR/GlpR family DNA-binding transcription regulator [Chitinophaga rhizophila]|uniref:DeoR/GlpR family DNA-binding transcription regulator n=1 Tax=Chitinophaga rhizophila TaxID=2866212 RepID=A0ABS7GI57_9BACT|nr:DeoR/GlpR family DNA-binding transcription regulator [Chitinophaga rhizophila]MBW8687372.1 DeoR/GlpR family DNA-binding transcription regulator [Chitinophaga rhizophila]